MIEGELPAGAKVLVIEDLISTGGGGTGRRSGPGLWLPSGGCFGHFQLQFPKGQPCFENAGCQLETLSNYDVLLREALAIKYINLNDVDLLTTWRTKTGNLNLESYIPHN